MWLSTWLPKEISVAAWQACWISLSVIDTYDTDINKAVDLNYLDFQKAVDKVPHERQLLKVNEWMNE